MYIIISILCYISVIFIYICDARLGADLTVADIFGPSQHVQHAQVFLLHPLQRRVKEEVLITHEYIALVFF